MGYLKRKRSLSQSSDTGPLQNQSPLLPNHNTNPPEEDGASSTSLVDQFFTQPKFSDFDYDPNRPVMGEFYRLCGYLGWTSPDPKHRPPKAMGEARQELKGALVQQFNQCYGKDPNSLESWRSLCQMIKIAPIPATMEECREAVERTHVNLVDLVDAKRIGTAVVVFPTVEALALYTSRTEKYFPQNHAEAGGVLKYLLRHINQPSRNGEARRGPARKRTRLECH